MGDLLVLRRSDIGQVAMPSTLLLDLVERAVTGIADGSSQNPPKISIQPIEHSMTIAMLAQFRETSALGMKAYTEFPLRNGRSRVGSTITLFDDASGAPLAFMDGDWITAARTAAVSALFAREAAAPESRTAFVVGAGAQAREAVPALLQACPDLEEIFIRAPRREVVEQLIEGYAGIIQGRSVRYSEDVSRDVPRADIVIGAGGPGAHGLVTHAMLKPGATAILLGYGIAADVLHKADRVLATSEAQMWTTGKDLVDENGGLPHVDAELSEILSGQKPARVDNASIIFAYNSGLAVTDVAVAAAVLDLAKRSGLGQLVAGF